jgi:hypothetical protein
MKNVIDMRTRKTIATRKGRHVWRVADYHPECNATSWDCVVCGLHVFYGRYEPGPEVPDPKPRVGALAMVNGGVVDVPVPPCTGFAKRPES